MRTSTSTRIPSLVLALALLAFPSLSLSAATPEENLAEAWTAYNLGKYAQALRILLPMAREGNPRAQVLVGRCCESGLGTPQDESQAAQWYSLAAAQGDGEAEVLLAYCHEQGAGVPKDSLAVVRLMSNAARRGHPEAQYNMALYYSQGKHGLPKSRDECFLWAEKAAVQGYAQAQLLVGACYENGIGVQRDANAAAAWYAKAAAQGAARDGAIFPTTREHAYPASRP